MTGSIPPAGPLAYEGQVVVPFITRPFPPQTTFNKFPVPTIWIDNVAENAYIQVAKPLGVAAWILIGGTPGVIDTITTPDATVVIPTGGNVNFLNGSAMSITGSGSSITFNSTGGGVVWVDVTGTTQAMAVNTGYSANNGSLVTLTLPAVAAFGSVIEVVGQGNGGWVIAQNAGQSIHIGSHTTTVGVAGSVASNTIHDSVSLVCTVANTEFVQRGPSGTFTVT